MITNLIAFAMAMTGYQAAAAPAAGVFALEATSLTGEKAPLSQYAGKTVLFVNVASRCGYTPQYEKLQALYAKYKDQGFVVLGFPSNDFMGQEPGTSKEIATFCKMTYGVTFPLFEKNPVSGAKAQPVYQRLVASAPKEEPGEVKWNFEKFLVDGEGRVVARYRSKVDPMDPTVVAKIESLLGPAKPAK